MLNNTNYLRYWIRARIYSFSLMPSPWPCCHGWVFEKTQSITGLSRMSVRQMIFLSLFFFKKKLDTRLVYNLSIYLEWLPGAGSHAHVPSHAQSGSAGHPADGGGTDPHCSAHRPHPAPSKGCLWWRTRRLREKDQRVSISGCGVYTGTLRVKFWCLCWPALKSLNCVETCD